MNPGGGIAECSSRIAASLRETRRTTDIESASHADLWQGQFRIDSVVNVEVHRVEGLNGIKDDVNAVVADARFVY